MWLNHRKEEVMAKYRIREGSFLDYARYSITGLIMFTGLAALAIF